MRPVQHPQPAHRVEAMSADAWDSFYMDYGDVVKLLDEFDALRDVAWELAESPRWTAAWTATAPRAWWAGTASAIMP